MLTRSLESNIKVCQLVLFLRGFLVTIPIWVSFYSGILTLQQMALLQTLTFATQLFLELPTGAFADLFGRKNSVALGILITAVSTTLVGFSTQAWQIFLFIICKMLGYTFVSGSMSAWIYDSLVELKKTQDYLQLRSLNNLYFQIAASVAMLVGGYTFNLWRGLPYLIEGLVFLLAAVLMFFLAIEPKIDSQKFTLKNYFKQTKLGFIELFKTKYVLALTAFYFVIGTVVNTAQRFYNQLYAQEIGFDEVSRGWLFFVIRVINMFVLYFWVKSSKFSRAKGLLFFPILIAMSYLPAFLGFKYLGAILLLGLTFGNSSRMTILNQFVNEEFSSRVRATALSALEMLVSLGFILVVYISGFYLEKFGTGWVLTVLGTVGLALSLPLSIYLIQHQSQESFIAKLKRNLGLPKPVIVLDEKVESS